MGRTVARLMLLLTLLAAGCSDSDDATTASTSVDDSVVLTATTAGTGQNGDDTGDDSDSDTDPDTSATTGTTTSTTVSTVAGIDVVDRAGFCQSDGRLEHVVRFDAGASSTAIDTTSAVGQVDLFRVDVGDDQIMSIELTSDANLARFGLLTPGDEPLDGPFTELIVERTTAGPQWICVTAGTEGGDHRLEISVINNNSPVKVSAPWCGDAVNDRGEIRFPAGQFSTVIEQAVVRGERDLYTFEAAADQALDLFLPSLEDNAVFDLRAPSGELLIDEVSDFRIPLPEDGVYEICIGSTRGNASYSLEIGIS